MTYTSEEMMVVTASRAVRGDGVCFVGIGAPSAACNLARLTHSPGLSLVYESGTIEAKPDVLPLSIGDGELCDSALTTVSVAEMFGYWLQGGRISIGFLGAAQIDRYANINTTVIGDYAHPDVRLPGGGGAPEIASLCDEVLVIVSHTVRTMVPAVDFVTSLGFGRDGRERERLGLTTKGPTMVITDLCLLRPSPSDRELEVTSIHPGISRQRIVERTGWPVRFAGRVDVTPEPTAEELYVLRDLYTRTGVAHEARS